MPHYSLITRLSVSVAALAAVPGAAIAQDSAVAVLKRASAAMGEPTSIRNNATVTWPEKAGKSLATVSFTEPGKFAATAFINDNYLVERVESRFPDAVLGEASAVTVYSDYRDYGGVKFPGWIQQSQGGFPVLDLAVKEVQPNAPAEFAVPDNVRGATERVAIEKVTDGV